MRHQCEYCGNFVEDTEEICPSCGAVNTGFQRSSNQIPKTIEELKQWYIDHNLPPEEVTRFFIGKDCREPKCFGIYKEGDRFIVYKNKDTGLRATRYDGPDEAYAVNEIYLKLKERIAEQKANNASRRSGGGNSKKSNMKSNLISALIIIGILVGVVVWAVHSPGKGYYSYNDDYYYYLDDDWYIYDNGYWTPTTVDSTLNDNYNDYYMSTDFDNGYGVSNFEDTDYYSDYVNSNGDWDSDSNWDSNDSWDSGGGDWGSDW